jgi:hypothetical protein
MPWILNPPHVQKGPQRSSTCWTILLISALSIADPSYPQIVPSCETGDTLSPKINCANGQQINDGGGISEPGKMAKTDLRTS